MPLYCPKKPDFDNVAKFVCDALNGVFWIDDKVIVDGRCIKMYSEQPRIELKVKEIEIW